MEQVPYWCKVIEPHNKTGAAILQSKTEEFIYKLAIQDLLNSLQIHCTQLLIYLLTYGVEAFLRSC
jgi:hypothetical protein